uniref:Uncharacterized protein n=1 Tax=Oryza barthii TaxID=65489 RepID=A0A0D3F7X9_9ORYZ
MRVARAAVVGKGAAVALQGRGARDNRRQRTWEAGIRLRWRAWAANLVKATRGEEDSATATHAWIQRQRHAWVAGAHPPRVAHGCLPRHHGGGSRLPDRLLGSDGGILPTMMTTTTTSNLIPMTVCKNRRFSHLAIGRVFGHMRKCVLAACKNSFSSSADKPWIGQWLIHGNGKAPSTEKTRSKTPSPSSSSHGPNRGEKRRGKARLAWWSTGRRRYRFSVLVGPRGAAGEEGVARRRRLIRVSGGCGRGEHVMWEMLSRTSTARAARRAAGAATGRKHSRFRQPRLWTESIWLCGGL